MSAPASARLPDPAGDAGWLRIPGPVQLAVMLCWCEVAALGVALMWSTGNVVQPMGGVSRLEGLAWTAGLVAALVLLVRVATAMHAGRRWGWPASLVIAVTGVVLGALLTIPFAMDLVATFQGRTYGMPMAVGVLWPAPVLCGGCVALLMALRRPESRRWFAGPEPARQAATVV